MVDLISSAAFRAALNPLSQNSAGGKTSGGATLAATASMRPGGLGFAAKVTLSASATRQSLLDQIRDKLKSKPELIGVAMTALKDSGEALRDKKNRWTERSASARGARLAPFNDAQQRIFRLNKQLEALKSQPPSKERARQMQALLAELKALSAGIDSVSGSPSIAQSAGSAPEGSAITDVAQALGIDAGGSQGADDAGAQAQAATAADTEQANAQSALPQDSSGEFVDQLSKNSDADLKWAQDQNRRMTDEDAGFGNAVDSLEKGMEELRKAVAEELTKDQDAIDAGKKTAEKAKRHGLAKDAVDLTV